MPSPSSWTLAARHCPEMPVPRLWIKVCGMRTREAIEAAAQAGADALGFVFHEASPRNLTVESASALQSCVPAGVERVAVFLRPSQDLVDGVVSAIQPDWVQTDAADLVTLRLPAGQRVLPVFRSGQARPAILPRRCLLESARSGAGERADWQEAAYLAAMAEVVLAGGLNAGNVGEAVRRVRPFGVDVSSGVESGRGVKDVVKIRDFIRAARAAAPVRMIEESR
jgi:phosphoribosylanthranilate isomerase